MGHAILIETPFASATQTAKILGVSKSRKKQIAKMLNIKELSSKDRVHAVATVSSKKYKAAVGTRWLKSSKTARRFMKVNTKRRLSSKGHASKKSRS